jgi:hypothetical protein
LGATIDSASASMTPFSAVIEAKVTTGNEATEYKLEYADSEEDLVKNREVMLVAEGVLPGVSEEQAASGEIGGLTPTTTYYYRVVASNQTGTTSTIEHFTTENLQPPVIENETLLALTQTTAKFYGHVDPEFQETLCAGWQYVDQQAFEEHGYTGAQETSCTPKEFGKRHVAVAPLEPQNSYGQDGTFTTTATPPILSGISVQGVTENGATVVATLDPDGLPTRYELQLGSIPGLWQLAASGSASTPTPLSLAVGSLSPSTTYYYKLTASNADDTESSAGAEGAFTTTPAPAGAAPAELPAAIPYQSIAQLDAKEALEDKGLPNLVVTRTLTRAEKLNKALHACHVKRGRKRAGCEAAAHRQYGGARKQRGRKK